MASQDPEVSEAIQLSGESTLDAATKKAQEAVDDLFNISLDIAVTGETGCGKSSFINAMRELSDDDEGAAATGVTESTTDPAPYKHPTMPNVTFWDLPGIGTPNFKANSYLKNMKLTSYDFFIIISSERFRENDIQLAKYIKKNKKLFYFVRSKIDNDVNAEKHKKSFNEKEMLTKIKQNCLQNLKTFGNPKVFLISSKDTFSFDFEELMNTLHKDLPKRKKDALMQSVPITSMAMLKKKVNIFEIAAWAAALCSGAIAIAPVPGLSVACDASILVTFFTTCYFSFGLDDKSLERLSKRVNKPNLKSLKKSPLALGLTSDSAMRVQLSALAGSAALEYVFSLFPGVGSAIAAGISFTVTYKLLKTGLKENEALMILREAGLK